MAKLLLGGLIRFVESLLFESLLKDVDMVLGRKYLRVLGVEFALLVHVLEEHVFKFLER